MLESKDLKTGDETSYAINGQTVKLKPVTLGKMKRAMEAFKKDGSDTFEMMLDSLFEILANGENGFATKDWINDNVTMPMATRIITDMRIINGLGDGAFFQPGGAKTPAAPLETRDVTGAAPTPSV